MISVLSAKLVLAIVATVGTVAATPAIRKWMERRGIYVRVIADTPPTGIRPLFPKGPRKRARRDVRRERTMFEPSGDLEKLFGQGKHTAFDPMQ